MLYDVSVLNEINKLNYKINSQITLSEDIAMYMASH